MTPDPSNDAATERSVERLRDLLVHEEPLPLGMVSRLEAAVRRHDAVDRRIGWEARLGIACVCFVVLSLWSINTAARLPLGFLAVVALLYPIISLPGAASSGEIPY